jgi:putative spermidine/putrescine transport system ATP-binding protein
MEKITSLVMRDVTRRFGGATALDHLTLEITGGTFVTLLGPSGCGKTTALNCLAGLLDLTEGEIVLNGAPIHHRPAEQRGFGMVFQNYALFPHLSARRNVAYGLELRRVPRGERERRVQRALELVHLEEFGARYPAQLSGGQQQRLAIARTIVLEPALLLLDEPLSNLDANLRTEMRIEIKRIHTQLGLTTLYVTHDQTEAMSLSEVVVVMRAGAIEQVGPPEQIYTSPRSLYVATFMGYANRLAATVLGRDGEHWAVRTAAGERLLGTTTTPASWPEGQPVVLCFRADETLAEPLPATNQLCGTVQLVEYLGKGFEAVVQLDGDRGEQVLVHCPRRVEPSAAVRFGIRPERLLLFPPDDDVAPAPGRALGPGRGAVPVATERR